MDPKRTSFYLGRKYDLANATGTTEPVMYDPANLTTHGVVTGMTGSGKTGLCIGLLEEAALQGIPALIVDPKGDLTNLVLHFPNFLPSDFEPWIDPELARRSGKSLADLAAETAANWQKGLAGGNSVRMTCAPWVPRRISPFTPPAPPPACPSTSCPPSNPRMSIGLTTARSCARRSPPPSPPCWAWWA